MIFAQADSNSNVTIILALIALISACIAALTWLIKYFATRLSKDLQEHTKAAVNQTVSNKKIAETLTTLNTKVEAQTRMLININKQFEINHTKDNP